MKSYTVCQLLRNVLLSSSKEASGLGLVKKNEGRLFPPLQCHVNCTIYDVIVMVSFSNNPLYANNWPCVDTGKEKVDPLFERRVSKVLQKQGMEHCCALWSFGQEGEEEHKLKNPAGIATNSLL